MALVKKKANSISVSDFCDSLKASLSLGVVAGHDGLSRRIRVPEVNRPGIALTGYFNYFASKRIQVIGKVEYNYLSTLNPEVRRRIYTQLMEKNIPCVIFARRYRPHKELIELGNKMNVPVIRSGRITMHIVNKASAFLEDEFAPTTCMSGTLMEVFGLGILITGKSGVGKSECALALIEKSHRLVSDDVVKIRKRDLELVGFGEKLTRHHMEVRGLGIINVQTLFGAGCVREMKKIDLVANLEEWDPNREYDRLGLDERTVSILGVRVPHLLIPVKPGRDLCLILETAALSQRLKLMGYYTAREFNRELLLHIQKKKHKTIPF